MKPFKLIMLIFLLLIFPAISHSQTLGDAHISLIEGDVQIRTEDTGDWVPASINIPLREGDRIWVPEGGKTELQLRDGTYLRLGDKSALEILTIDKDSFQFYLTEGHAYTNFKGQRGSFLQMDTPASSIRVYERSTFEVDLSEDGLNQISVLKGSVDVESRSGKTTVKSGYTLTLKDETYAELSRLGPPDDWERWNMERDRRLAERRPPPSYLPEELYGYTSDFETYGRWVYVREYGYVWRPTVVVSVGWAPYRIGRWVWIAGDYVWISYEPWGWVPYHYGRWAFVASFGWCWVPPVRGAVFWGPGFVAWLWTPTYVAWVPLGPREIYYGHGHYGPHSVNITNVNITNIQVNKTVYKNIHVHNAVTVVHHDTFVKGKHVDIKVKENPFLKEKINVGRPDIKPERATVMPVVKEVPQAKRPPEPIREIKVREIKEKRPLVREREASVLRPQLPPKEMTLKVSPSAPQHRDRSPGRVEHRESRPSERVIEKPREVKPEEREMERLGELPSVERGIGKQRELQPQERGVVRPLENKPPGRRVERPREFKPEERGVQRLREIKPPEKGVESPKEFISFERRIEKSRLPEIGVERQRRTEGPTERQPIEKGSERFRESSPGQKRIEKPRSQADLL